MGITRLANVTGLDYLKVPVFMAIRPGSRSLSVAQGKGLDVGAAKVSAFMEAAETFHAEQATPTIARARMRDLDAGAEVIDWARLPKLRSRRFTPAREIAWSKAETLDAGEPLWVPFEMVHTDYRTPVAPYFPLASNGLASGNHRLEAICAALLELIERDATTLWRQRSSTERASKRIDLETVDHEACRELIDRLRARGIAVSVWDVTTDIGVAAFLCRIEEAADNPQPRLGGFYGSGCHLARNVAFLRAVTEAVQTRLTYIAGSRDDLRRRDYSESAGEAILSIVLPAWERGFSQRRYCDVPDVYMDSFDEDLEVLAARLRSAGIGKVAVVDLTRRDFELPVVRVIAPGLEFIDDNPAYVPGERARRLIEEREWQS